MFKASVIEKHPIDRRLCVAPMIGWTDRHCRYFHRLLAPNSLLFTEMIAAEAILYAGPARFHLQNENNYPLAIQLGGSDPVRLAKAVEAIVAISPHGVDEINLNIGCPSPRVQLGRFGACLMSEPELVGDCVRAMQACTHAPVTVKCRIGIDDMDPQSGLNRFVEAQIDAGVKAIYLHARKAWLQGLSPAENRNIPPLDYQRAIDLALDYPEIDVIVNGGITSIPQMRELLTAHMRGPVFAGIMIGRTAYKTPEHLSAFSRAIYQNDRQELGGADLESLDLLTVLDKMSAYASQQISQGVPLHSITRHMLGLFAGRRGARHWRYEMSETARQTPNDAELITRTARFCLNMPPRQTHPQIDKKVA